MITAKLNYDTGSKELVVHDFAVQSDKTIPITGSFSIAVRAKREARLGAWGEDNPSLEQVRLTFDPMCDTLLLTDITHF